MVVSSAATEIQAPSVGQRRVTDYFPGKYRARNDFIRGEIFAVYEVAYPEKSDMPKSDMTGSILNTFCISVFIHCLNSLRAAKIDPRAASGPRSEYPYSSR